jgi:hypothetical protein
MARSVAPAESSMRSNSLDTVRTTPLKASLDGQSSSVPTSTIVKDALMRHYGSLKAAALSMTPRMDEGQLSRELKSGDFKLEKLDRLDGSGRAFVAEAMHKACGDVDPKAVARQLIRELRQRLDALAEVVE